MEAWVNSSKYRKNVIPYDWLHGGNGDGRKRALSWDARFKAGARLIPG
jgi:hypothetical protein